MKNDIQSSILQLIKDSLADLDLAQYSAEALYLDFPTDNRFGDLSTNAGLRLSKILKKPPFEIARGLLLAIQKRLENDPLKEFVSAVKVEGAGFINFYLTEGYFYAQLENLIKQGKDSLKVDLGKGKKTMIEFVSANPTGPLSVAHARQAVVGDVLANIFAFSGFAVKREYYLNDEGNQINILGNSVKLRLQELSGEKIEFPEDHYQGEYIYDIAKEIKEKNLTISDFPEYAGNYILEIIKKELDDFGVKFDCWYSQKELRKSGKIEQTLDYLKSKGHLYEEEGALWFKSTQFGDDKDRVVIKSDGSYTYLAPDIAYHKTKYDRGFEKLINLLGPDHHGYIGRLKAAVAALGHDPDTLSVIIVQLATIFRAGKPVQMSTRRGQYITLREVYDEVGFDASRFFFVMRRTASHLDFDLEVAKKQTAENPVYYCQYAHARICSILRNSPLKAELSQADFSLLKEKEELALIKKQWHFHSIMSICVNTQDPYMLTVYLQELAESFHKFYDQHRVLGQADQLTIARLGLIDGTRVVLAAGLELLGISQPETM